MKNSEEINESAVIQLSEEEMNEISGGTVRASINTNSTSGTTTTTTISSL